MTIYPPILVVGSSGSGKSSSLQNLNPAHTVVLNIERKILPFRTGVKFNNINIGGQGENPIQEYMSKLDEAIKNPTVDVIVHESFTAFSDELLKFSKKINKGYDIYNYYADKVIILFDRIKFTEGKWHIVLAIDELVEFMAPNGVRTTSRRCGVNGQKLEGKIENHFTLVFFTEVVQGPDKSKPANYYFLTNNDGTTSAKSPAGMFGEIRVANDINNVISKACAYWGFPPPRKGEEPMIPEIKV